MADHPQLAADKVVEKRSIVLPQGGTLEVQMTSQFITKLRQHYGLPSDQPLDDDHVRMYVWGSLNVAVDKAEQELQQNVKKPGGITIDESAPRVRRARRRKKGQGS